MRVRFSTIAQGPEFTAQPNDVRDVDAAFAADLVAGGYAVALDPAPEPEPDVEAGEPIDIPPDDAPSEPNPKPAPARKKK